MQKLFSIILIVFSLLVTGAKGVSYDDTLFDVELVDSAKSAVGLGAKTTKSASSATAKSKVSPGKQQMTLSEIEAKNVNNAASKTNLAKLVRHHIFNKFRGSSQQSQKYRDFFKKHNIDIDNYTIEIPADMHVKHIHAAGNNWTTKWKNWIDKNPDASTKEVYQFAGSLMDSYGVNKLPLVHYNKKRK